MKKISNSLGITMIFAELFLGQAKKKIRFIFSITFLFNIIFGTESTQAQNVNMANASVTRCGSSFFDSGGNAAQYGNSQNFVLTIAPTTACNNVRLTFSAFATEAGFDNLSIFNGTSIAEPLIGTYSGGTSPGTITSSSPTGALTIRFTSDGSVTAAGWAAAITCVATTAMTYTSATSASVAPATMCLSSSVQMQRVEVVTGGGTCTPLNLTSLTVNKTGTAPLTAFDRARVYYTGTSSTFSAINEFVAGGLAPAASMTFNASQTLAVGTNYFWVVYDVNATGVTGNTLGAQMPTSPTTCITVGGTARTLTSSPNGLSTFAAMTYTSATSASVAPATISTCLTSSVQMQRIEIVTGGVTCTPLNLTSLTVNKTGTAPLTAFNRARVYYTGTSSTFSPINEFVVGGLAPAASMTFNATQALAIGTNYFWVVYDLNGTGVAGNTLGAQMPASPTTCITVGGTARALTSSPNGLLTFTVCSAPGGITAGLQTWLKADAGYAAGAPATWTNQAPGVATLINGTSSPAKNTTSTSYNYNPYIEFAGPSGAIVDGGADPVRQFVRLAGNNDLIGPTFRSLFYACNLTDLSRVYTHLATVNGISGSTPADGSLSGFDNGGNAAIMFSNHDPADFGNSAAANTWQRNGANVNFDAVHLTTKHVLSGLSSTANGTIINRFLGGQNDNAGFSFEGGTRDWRGPVGEVIGYSSQLTGPERSRVHTYLAIKYGVTLGENYLNTAGTNIYTPTAPYNLNIIGIGRDDVEELNQKQSHQDDDTVRIYLNTIAATNIANGGSFSSNVSYVVQGANNGRLRTTAAAMADIPTGLTSCAITSRLEREWKVTRTNMAQTYNMDVKLSSSAAPGSVNVAHLRLLIDADGDFTSGAQCFYNGDGTGLVFTYTNPTITITGINIANHIPNNSTRFITIASINAATPLPIEIISFDAKLNEKETVDLTWETSSERDNDYFTIEKSTDGNNWDFLGTVNGAGTTNTPQTYYMEDKNPFLGTNYYKLKQTDFNGTSTEVGIRTVELSSDEIFILSPNPAKNQVAILGQKLSDYKIKVYNNLGEIVSVNSINATDSKIELDIQNLAAGMYFVSLKSPIKNKVLKLVIEK